MDRNVNPEKISSVRQKHHVLAQIRQIESEATESGRKRLRTLFGVKEAKNPLLRLPVDMCQ